MIFPFAITQNIPKNEPNIKSECDQPALILKIQLNNYIKISFYLFLQKTGISINVF